MSTLPPVTFRFPFSLDGQPKEVQQAHVFAFNAVLDLQRAIAALKSQLTATNQTITTISTSSSSGSTPTPPTAFPFPGLGAINDQTGVTAYTILNTDNGILLILNDASPVAITLDSAMVTPYFLFVTNFGAGAATLTPTSGLIDGSASLSLLQYQSVLAVFDGTNWKTTAIAPTGTEAYRAITSATTILSTDWQIEATTGTFTQPLPTAVGIAGKIYSIKNSGTGVITVSTTSSQTIDGSLTQPLHQWENLTVMSNGTNWIIL